MFRIAAALAVTPFAILGATAASAEDRPRPTALTALAACRSIADNAERLACFDRQAAAFEEAEKRGDLLVADRAEIRKSKRTLFGLNLPDFSLFRKRDDAPEEPEIREIETTLSGASYVNRAWTFVLADGARWRQTDPLTLFEPKAGDRVFIRRAAMGSYFLKVGSQRAVRAQRIN